MNEKDFKNGFKTPKTRMPVKTEKPSLKIVALLTGRGGSSLKDKNILKVSGKPLLYYPAKAAIDSRFIDDYYVSSDSQKILDAAKKIGYIPIKRPQKISKANSQHGDVIKHGLDFLKKKGIIPDILVVLLANTVVVKTKWIDDCIEALITDKSLTTVAPVYPDSDHHPFRSKKIGKNGLCEPFFNFSGKKISTNRQDLDPSFFFCHNFWVLRGDNLDKVAGGQPPWAFMGNKIKPYIIKGGYIDVHDMKDLEESRRWLKKYGHLQEI